MPPGGTKQVTKQGRDFHAGEGTSFSGSRPSVIHRVRGQAALVPEDELLEPEDEEPEDDEPDDPEEPLDDDPDDPDDPLDDDPEPDEDDPDEEDDASDFAGTELLPDDRLSFR